METSQVSSSSKQDLRESLTIAVRREPGSQGTPSEADWELHKATIIDIYKRTSMGRLQREMETLHDFKATKRMYDRRFRKWEVAKNMSKSDKVKILASLDGEPKAHSAALRLSRKDREKIERFQRSEFRGARRMREVLSASANQASFSPSMPPVLSDDARTRTAYCLLRNVEVCCQIQLRDASDLGSYGCTGRESGSGQTPRLFWQDIKHAIRSGRTASSPASTTAHGILRAQMSGTSFESFDFVWEIFATLSSVNTAACPGLRRNLLSRLWVATANRLHVSHPVAEICGLLYQCAEHFELASAALVKAWSVFGRRLGDAHPATCRLRRLIIRIARRGRRLQCAELMARELYGRVCSDGTRSYLARSCARSLSHVLVDLGRLDDARHICLAIVGSASPEDAGPGTCGLRTVQAMEDLARIELLASDVQASLWWLRRARAAAERLWPESMLLRSIDEKLLSEPRTEDQGWRFPTSSEAEVDGDNVVPDPLHEGFTLLRQIYFETDPNYSARFSVPVLYDKIQKVTVNNESSDILRMLGAEFDDIIDEKYRNVSLYPATLQDQTDDAHAWQYDQINNGVYKCGFAVTRDAYEHAVTSVFDGLDRAEAHLASPKPSDGPYWFGKEITEVDIRLFVTLIRFDPIYTFHSKCNIRDIRSGYPRLHNWLRNLYWNVPAFKDTTNFIHIKKGYTKSQTNVNPLAITAMGPLPHILSLEDEVPAVRISK